MKHLNVVVCGLLLFILTGKIFAKDIIQIEKEIPQWLINKTWKDGKVNITGLSIRKGRFRLGAGASEDRAGLGYLICRRCTIYDKTTGAHVDINGLIFEKRGFTLRDIMGIRHQSTQTKVQFIFDNENKKTVKRFRGPLSLYQNMNYLKKLGYGAYLDIPIRSVLARKALNGDLKAQVIYGLYWQEHYWLDAQGPGLKNQMALFKHAAHKNVDAAALLGALYKELNQSDEALLWLTKAAKAGRAMAQYKLALLHVNGSISKPDLKQAYLLFDKAANQGLYPAWFDVGLMHYNGRGLPKNRKKGENAIALAAANGLKYAKQIFSRCKVEQPRIVRNKLVFKACQ